ncbi:hypothetical protein J5X84_13230 [Streptosporangiaceae bacterium NEAU-GS5]|nr:hypothetical protein [Streptosporangiaceae bacterium NEAU-GS5]
MRTYGRAALPLFRTAAQGQLLSKLFLQPDKRWTLAALARELNTAPSSLHAEVHRLEAAGLIKASEVGRSRLLEANPDHPIARPLVEVLRYFYGPPTVIAEEYDSVQGIEHLLIFGSWAARQAGEPGPPPNDIDVLVVGTASRSDVYAAADRSQQRIGITVNPVLASAQRWEAASDALIRQIKSSPTIDLTSALEST